MSEQFEPWHMITSFIQYLLMAPSYINVLNVYAVRSLSVSSLIPANMLLCQFANVHDVSWGTKGDNKVSTDLGVVQTGKNKNEVEVAVPTAETDINAAYEDAIHVLSTKPEKVDPKPDPATQQEDYYRSFRTNVLLSWTLSNGLLAAAVVYGVHSRCKLRPVQANGYAGRLRTRPATPVRSTRSADTWPLSCFR
jgi:chitin synthase